MVNRLPIYPTVRMYRGNGPLGMQAGTTDRGYVVFSEDIYAEDDDGDGYPDVGAEQSFAHQTYSGNKVSDTAECRTTLEDLGPTFAGNAGCFVCLTGTCPDYSFQLYQLNGPVSRNPVPRWPMQAVHVKK